MELQFYGVRGSCPTPINQGEYQNKVKNIIDSSLKIYKANPNLDINSIYNQIPSQVKENVGGNTTCVYIQSRSGQHYIFDMGTGIRELGNRLAEDAFSKEGIDLSVFMTHTHWDHIQGWPFFKPAYSPNTRINFYSCIPNLEERLDRQQWEENFPLGLSLMPSKKIFITLNVMEEIQIGELYITPFFIKHPGNCTGYKIREGNQTIVFATDVEFRPENKESIQHLCSILGEVDALIIDAQYSSDEANKKIGWGHTSIRMAVYVADQIKAKKVYLTHFEPDHSDELIYEIVQDEIGEDNCEIDIIVAREGMKFQSIE